MLYMVSVKLAVICKYRATKADGTRTIANLIACALYAITCCFCMVELFDDMGGG